LEAIELFGQFGTSGLLAYLLIYFANKADKRIDRVCKKIDTLVDRVINLENK